MDQDVEIWAVLPSGGEERLVLRADAAGEELVDEVLSLCGLGQSARNRMRVVLSNPETGEPVGRCARVGSVGESS